MATDPKTIDPLARLPDVVGTVVYAGDYDAEAIGDLHGVPVIVIRTTRAALRAGPPLVYQSVRVTLEGQS